MWEMFLGGWNGISMFIPTVFDSSPKVFSDAATSRGYATIGVTLDPGVQGLLPLFELYPIVATASVWGHLWTGHTVLFLSDNCDVVESVNKSQSKSLLIMLFLHRLVWLALCHQVHFVCSRISGDCNSEADALS